MFRLLFAVTLVLPLCAEAGGSVSFHDDIAPLLAKKPELAQKLAGLSLAPIGDGLRIGHQVCPALAGKRIGPYEFVAAQADGSKVTVLFHTRDRFFAPDGTLLAQYLDGFPVFGDDIFPAVSAQEELEDITTAPDAEESLVN